MTAIHADRSIHADRALLPDGWARDVRVLIERGVVGRVETDVRAHPGDLRQRVLVPGLSNLHSHAFQRVMAGRTEVRGTQADSFWTWRDLMYRFAHALDPDQVQAIAAQAYVEMLEAGFTRVGEFHYLHHDRDGASYADIAELAGRIVAAAADTGIALTLLPVFYAHSNFAGAAPHDGQRRFLCDLDRYARLLEGCERHTRRLAGSRIGIAPHSLRATTRDELDQLVAMAGQRPIHIHIAEQTKEVDDCLAWSGKRPVEWLFDHFDVDARWCLIHATHMTPAEVGRLARSGAVAGLCPVTEANLGDGTFEGAAFAAAGGRFGVGTDSNVLIDAAGELRQLEYSQRLKHRARNVLAKSGGSTGRALFDAAVSGGASALGAGAASIAAGSPADLVTLDPEAGGVGDLADDAVLDAWIFAGRRLIDSVWVGGDRQVIAGRHVRREGVAARFHSCVRECLPS